MDVTPLLTVLLGISTAALGFLAYSVMSLRSLLAERGRLGGGETNEEAERVVELSLDMLCAAGFDGKVRLVNPAFTRALGWTRQELYSAPFHEFVHPDDREAVRAEMERMRRGLPTMDFRNRALCRDGSSKLLSWRCMPDVNRGIVYCIARDLSGDEQLFRTFVEGIDHVVWIEDPETRRIVYVSPAYERIWGRPCSQVYENPKVWLEGVHPDDRDRVAAAWASQYVVGKCTEEYRVVRPDGSVRWVRDHVTPVRAPTGRITRMLGLVEDVTDRRAEERSIRDEETLAALASFATGFVREIRDPLVSIQRAAMVARTSSESGLASSKVMSEIVVEAERCERLLEKLLCFAYRSGASKTACHVADAVRRAHEIVRPDADRYGTNLTVELAEPSPLVSLNEAGFQQVIRSLVENACQAGAKNLGIRADGSGGLARVIVEDDGEGISASDQERIFEPFFTTRREHGGAGMGLTLTHGIVLDHGGTVQVESEPGRGTRMILTFPTVDAAAKTRGGNGMRSQH
jgi:PAS domain S-box-containing protein